MFFFVDLLVTNGEHHTHKKYLIIFYLMNKCSLESLKILVWIFMNKTMSKMCNAWNISIPSIFWETCAQAKNWAKLCLHNAQENVIPLRALHTKCEFILSHYGRWTTIVGVLSVLRFGFINLSFFSCWFKLSFFSVYTVSSLHSC